MQSSFPQEDVCRSYVNTRAFSKGSWTSSDLGIHRGPGTIPLWTQRDDRTRQFSIWENQSSNSFSMKSTGTLFNIRIHETSKRPGTEPTCSNVMRAGVCRASQTLPSCTCGDEHSPQQNHYTHLQEAEKRKTACASFGITDFQCVIIQHYSVRFRFSTSRNLV